jgi:hypothetical protein
MALGANRGGVRGLVIGESAKLVFIGLAAGIPVALVLTRFLSTTSRSAHISRSCRFADVRCVRGRIHPGAPSHACRSHGRVET